MKTARTIAEARAIVEPERRGGASVGFVPTMGALHEGHLSLVKLARAQCDMVVLSIFVNPLQFGPHEDLATYPRNEERDLELAVQAGVDLVFLPKVDEMYPPDETTRVSVGRLSEFLEGESRPGHFDGVATIVAKLFNIVQPDRAYFGQKDAQQVAVVKRMTADLEFPMDIVVGATVRESDGLALSSRNVYLSPDERRSATLLYRALNAGQEALASSADPEVAEKAMRDVLTSSPDVEVDYARAVDPASFSEPAPQGPVLLVVAAKVGTTRLIDNLLVD